MKYRTQSNTPDDFSRSIFTVLPKKPGAKNASYFKQAAQGTT